MAAAKIAYIRLRDRAGFPAGSLVPELTGYGNRALSKVTLGEVFPVLVDSLPPDLRAEYDEWEAQQSSAPDADEPITDDATDYEALTKADLHALLDERGVEHPANATKADLIALLD